LTIAARSFLGNLVEISLLEKREPVLNRVSEYLLLGAEII